VKHGEREILVKHRTIQHPGLQRPRMKKLAGNDWVRGGGGYTILVDYRPKLVPTRVSEKGGGAFELEENNWSAVKEGWYCRSVDGQLKRGKICPMG